MVAAASRRELQSPFQVVIVYEDFAAGQRAMDTRNLIAAEFGGDAEVRTGIWKFEVLANPELSRRAALEAAEADVVIVSTSRARELPVELTDWMESWLPQKRGQTAALVALLGVGAAGNASASSAGSYLKSAAEDASLEFIHREIPAESSNRVLPRMEAVGSTAELTVKPAPECWGLND